MASETEARDTEREWILYFHGYGAHHPVGCYPDVEAAQAHAGIGTDIVWSQTSATGYVGYPFANDRAAAFYYTVNQDGRAVYKALMDEMKRDKPLLAQAVELLHQYGQKLRFK